MVTNTITGRSTEGNRRVHYGVITGSSEGVIYFKTGLRSVDSIDASVVGVSGGFAIIMTPISFPALDSTSGNFCVTYTPTSGQVVWRAKGVI